MDIVPKDSRYVPLTQQKWCCTVTCFQMVMLRHAIPLVPAELLGYHLGLIVPEDGKKFFWNARVGSKPPAGFGTQRGKPQYGPNAVFRKFHIPLKVSWSLINRFPSIGDYKKYLYEVVKKGVDVLVCFDWGVLHDNPEYHNGHVCLLDTVNVNKDEVRIVDPDYNAPKWQIVPIDKLYEAMKFHGAEKSGGFWEVRPIKPV